MSDYLKSRRDGSGREKIKKTPEIAKAFYDGLPKQVIDTKYILLKPAEVTDAGIAKLVVCLVNPDQLSALIHLFCYESSLTDNVYIPMSSGCTSIFKLPFAELKKESPRAVVGLADIWARPPFKADQFAFTVPFEDYIKMLENSKDCFFQVKTWDGVKKRLK